MVSRFLASLLRSPQNRQPRLLHPVDHGDLPHQHQEEAQVESPRPRPVLAASALPATLSGGGINGFLGCHLKYLLTFARAPTTSGGGPQRRRGPVVLRGRRHSPTLDNFRATPPEPSAEDQDDGTYRCLPADSKRPAASAVRSEVRREARGAARRGAARGAAQVAARNEVPRGATWRGVLPLGTRTAHPKSSRLTFPPSSSRTPQHQRKSWRSRRPMRPCKRSILPPYSSTSSSNKRSSRRLRRRHRRHRRPACSDWPPSTRRRPRPLGQRPRRRHRRGLRPHFHLTPRSLSSVSSNRSRWPRPVQADSARLWRSASQRRQARRRGTGTPTSGRMALRRARRRGAASLRSWRDSTHVPATNRVQMGHNAWT